MRSKLSEEKDIRYYIGMDLIIFSVLCNVVFYQVCVQRVIQATRDLFTSLAYHFMFMFGKEDKVTPTVNSLGNISFDKYLPFDIYDVKLKLESFWEAFWSFDNFNSFLEWFCDNMALSVLLMSELVLLLVILFSMAFRSFTEGHIEQKNLTKAHMFILKGYGYFKKISDAVKTCIDYFREHKGFIYVLAVLWLVNINAMTILVDAVAYYFYFISSADFLSLGTQVVKFVRDTIIMFLTLPTVIWAIIGYKIFDKVRKNMAIGKLEHMEAKNRGYDNELPIVAMATGTVGVGKTKTVVDITLSKQNELRDRALSLMDKNMMRFPNFDFMAFEGTLKELIKERKIKNLATTRQYIRELRFDYGRHPAPEKLWGYDVGKFPRSYNNGLELVGIWRVLENYAQEYFIYSMTVSLIISNIAIRSDLDIIDEGYFVSFNMDFFRRDPAKVGEYSAYAHIIDFDLFRVGCQMNKENAIAGSFEFGIIVVSEIGKERKNMLELKEIKKNCDEANQKNDLFNEWLKMIRHAGTVEGYCFVFFICDEQRPESWGADARDLCAILNIRSCSELKLSIRFCFIPVIFTEFVSKKYFGWYHEVRKYGNDNVFAVKMLHRVMSAIFSYSERIINTYGYYTEIIAKESGTMTDEHPEEHNYYLMIKKIYAGRYSTDCFKDAFAQRALQSGTSLYYINTYETACAVLEELARQNSYMANTFINMYYGVKK